MKRINGLVPIIMMIIAGAMLPLAAQAGDAKAAQAASLCAGCHGPKGVSSNPLWPNLAGQQEQYLIKQIKAFRDGQRNDPSMAPMVKSLSDADIDNLAAYFSSL